MARWRVDIQKRFGTEYWTNRYIVETADIGTARAAGLDIVERERAITDARVQFDKLRVDDGVKGTDVFSITTLSGTGSAAGDTSLLPLFNVVRVDFNVINGRPSRKYLRGCLTEGNTVDGKLHPNVISAFTTNYAAPMASDVRYVDVDGQQFMGGVVVEDVGMRQLRRGSKRKLKPVIA